MVDKKEDEKEKNPLSDSSEIFESIFKEATQEIQKETGKVPTKARLKLKAEAKAKPEARPKAPIKLELEPKEEPEQKPRFEARPETKAVAFKPRQDTIRKPLSRTQAPSEEARGAGVVPVEPLARSRFREQKPKGEPSRKAEKPNTPKKQGRGSPVFRIVLLLVLLAVGVGGASVYLGIIDLSDYVGQPEPATNEAPKIAGTKTSAAQTAAKPPQPSQPQAKPAEAPKPPAQPQMVQSPQAPPKPAETVTSLPLPLPPEVQAKPATPAPPAIAKAQIPAPAAPVQQPVESQPQIPQAPVQAPLKSEPKVPPAPVQPPTASPKVESPQVDTQSKEVAVTKAVSPVGGSGVSYPYSVYLASIQSLDYVKRTMSDYERQGLSTYWSKVALGAKGTWYRIFTGYFRSAQEAEAFIQQRRIKEGEIKETRYANLIGSFGTKQEGEEKALALNRMGLSAYWIPGTDDQVRLCSGAFITKEGAEKNQVELNSRGIKSEIVER